MGERSRRRVHDLVTQRAFEGRSQNETERARDIHDGQEMICSTQGPDTEAQDQTTVLKIQLATHGRSIQMGQFRPIQQGRLDGVIGLPVAWTHRHCDGKAAR